MLILILHDDCDTAPHALPYVLTRIVFLTGCKEHAQTTLPSAQHAVLHNMHARHSGLHVQLSHLAPTTCFAFNNTSKRYHAPPHCNIHSIPDCALHLPIVCALCVL